MKQCTRPSADILRWALAAVPVFAAALPVGAQLSASDIRQVHERRAAVAETLCRATIDDPEANPLQFAFAALWLNERTAEGNARLREWFATGHRTEEPLELLLQQPDAYAEELATSIRGLKWSARTWIRIYYLFNDESPYLPGRLERDVQEQLETLFWALANQKSSLERARLEYIWAIQGSENHDMMDLSNAFMILQVLKDHPRYREMRLRDGSLPAAHYEAWNRYYKAYCRERALHGLFVELSSPIYGKHFLGELFNIHDFAEDADLRELMGMLLDVTWADWAVDQLGGVRGGGRTRSYFGHYSQRGTSDSWLAMSNYLLGRPNPARFSTLARHGQVEYVIATSRYRLPDVVVDLALDPAGRGEYVYRSLRPARMVRREEVRDRPPLREGTWYHMDPADPRMVRYSYCTPDYVMGSLWVDPGFVTTWRLEPPDAETSDSNGPEPEHYAAISSQSRWQGIIFATDVNARVFSECIGEEARARVNYHQHVAVQHENVMLVQKGRNTRSAGAMRIFFADGMKERLIERDGDLFLREGDAFLAVRILSRRSDAVAEPWQWDGRHWVVLADEYAPVVFVAGRAERHDDLENFIAYAQTHRAEIDSGRLTYRFEDRGGNAVTLALHIRSAGRLPEINGEPIDLRPDWVFDSPFLSLERGGSRIEIRKGERRLVHDLSRP